MPCNCFCFFKKANKPPEGQQNIIPVPPLPEIMADVTITDPVPAPSPEIMTDVMITDPVPEKTSVILDFQPVYRRRESFTPRVEAEIKFECPPITYYGTEVSISTMNRSCSTQTLSAVARDDPATPSGYFPFSFPPPPPPALTPTSTPTPSPRSPVSPGGQFTSK